MDLLRQSSAIVIVLALLGLLLRWLKSRGFATFETRLKRSKQVHELELVEKLALTPQHSVQLLRFRQQLWLVGLHATGLVILGETAVLEPAPRETAPK